MKDDYINPSKNLTSSLAIEGLSANGNDQEGYEIDPNSVTIQPIKWVDYRVEHLGQNTFEIQVPSSVQGSPILKPIGAIVPKVYSH